MSFASWWDTLTLHDLRRALRHEAYLDLMGPMFDVVSVAEDILVEGAIPRADGDAVP